MILTTRRIRALAAQFDRDEAASPWTRGERRLKARLARRRARGTLHLTRQELRWIGEWKSPRIRPQIARNSEAGVRGVTEAAFLARGEKLEGAVRRAKHFVTHAIRASRRIGRHHVLNHFARSNLPPRAR